VRRNNFWGEVIAEDGTEDSELGNVLAIAKFGELFVRKGNRSFHDGFAF
jgi:hypothetical protein